MHQSISNNQTTKAIVFTGQGAQYKGMGKDLFPSYPHLVDQANTLLGYDIQDLCLNNPENRLSLTQFTQPAQFVVNALFYYDYLQQQATSPDYFLGHSLGEYNALLAAGVFDFSTGLRLVAQRGKLMGRVHDGGMLAILNEPIENLRDFLHTNHLGALDIANYNTQKQIVISGKATDIKKAADLIDNAGIKGIPLNVKSPFHSRYMQEASQAFANFIEPFTFHAPHTPVIANTDTLPYTPAKTKQLLAQQIVKPVLWYESITKLLRKDAATSFEEMGGTVLTKMIRNIRKDFVPDKLTVKTVVPKQKVKLFCIAHAGGDFRAFSPLKHKLKSTVEVIPLDRAGRGRRLAEALLTDFDSVLEDIFAQLPTPLNEPYAILGHSFGARLAFQLCQHIRKAALPAPLHLFILGDRGPSAPVLEKETHQMHTTQFWDRLNEIGGVPKELFEYPKLIQFFEKIIRADLTALSTYQHRYEKPFNFPITTMIGTEETITREEASLWGKETTANFLLQYYQGGHFFIKENLRSIAEYIEESIHTHL